MLPKVVKKQSGKLRSSLTEVKVNREMIDSDICEKVFKGGFFFNDLKLR